MTVPWDNRTIQAILFDLDGTLIDTDDVAVARLATRLRPWLGDRADVWARWIVMKIETPGNLLITFFDILSLDRWFFALGARLRGASDDAPPHFQLVPGVEEMLDRLQGTYRMGIVTTRSSHHIHQFRAAFPHIDAMMDVQCGSDDTQRLKPHPQPVQRAAELLGVPVTACMMVGDTTMDVLSGRRANAWSVAVLCGFGERAELQRAGAHLILESTADLAEVLLAE